MALVKLKSGKMMRLDHERAVSLWEVLNGDIPGNTAQQNFVKEVERVFLDWRKAPVSYLIKYREAIAPMAKEQGIDIDAKIKPLRLWYEDK